LDLTDTADVLVIGGGVFGLSVARSCASAGLSVILTEAKRIGAGASGGLVGALVPHRPGHWRGFEQFQFDALAELPTRMAALARASGCDPGYARTGRLSPLADAGQRARAEAQMVAARKHWAGDARLEVLEGLPEPLSGWLAQASFPFGLVHETVSARIAPRRYLAALKAVLTAAMSGRADIREGWRCTGLDPVGGVARFAQGEITAGYVVLAAGTGGIPLLERLMARPCGSGVKGQAALLDIQAPLGLPVIQGHGLYIVAHGRGGVAVGSTSEKTWDRPGPDAGLDALITRARALCPALAQAPVAERWAGIRPRAPGNAPMVGPLAGFDRLIVAAGGYKTGLGIAHLIGDAVAAMVRGQAPRHPMPAEFAPERHFSRSAGG
jgi:glycine/D-amino acid oxidase-like deaminating enzyme